MGSWGQSRQLMEPLDEFVVAPFRRRCPIPARIVHASSGAQIKGVQMGTRFIAPPD